MISRRVTSIIKIPLRNYCKMIKVNGRTYEVPKIFEEPEYDEEKLSNSSNVILVRHANTIFNLEIE